MLKCTVVIDLFKIVSARSCYLNSVLVEKAWILFSLIAYLSLYGLMLRGCLQFMSVAGRGWGGLQNADNGGQRGQGW